MDRLTQTQTILSDLILIMSSTLSYLTRNSTFHQLNPDLPITQTIPNEVDRAVFQANQQELVDDFMSKAKQAEYLIDALPSEEAMDAETEWDELEREMKVVNDEYERELVRAEKLQERLEIAMQAALRT